MNWPVLIILAIGVKLSSPGPIIFKQRRIADLHGAEFVDEDLLAIEAPASPASAPSSAVPRSTNCPSSSTSCRAA
jgi:hypothetical protein